MANNSCVTQDDLLLFYNTYVKPYINAESGGHEIKNDGDVTTLEQRELMTFKSPIFAADNSSTQSTDIDVDTNADLSSFPIPVTSKQEWEHNYSTSERVVGTWIDSRPLYEKTYEITTPFTITTNTMTAKVLETDTTKEVIFANGVSITNNSIRFMCPCTFDQRPNGEIRAVFKDITTSSVTFDKIQVTIQYTKTTDISNS